MANTMDSRYEGWTRTELLETQSRSRGSFKIQEALSRAAIARTLALPTPLHRDDKDDEHSRPRSRQKNPGTASEWNQSPADDKQGPAQGSLQPEVAVQQSQQPPTD